MFGLTSQIFSLCPRVHKEADCLRVVTGWRVWILTLGVWSREVVVDPGKRTIHLHDRVAWLIPFQRRVKFRRVKAITYSHSDPTPFAGLMLIRDTLDVFSVGLRLHGKAGEDEIWPLFHFRGEGPFLNDSDWPDWMFWSELALDVVGTQEHESRVLVDLLSAMTDTEVVPG